MSDESGKAVAGGRSPAYPFITLEKALARAEELRKAVGRNETRIDSAKSHWKYGPKSSGGIQTVAALRHFGLVDDLGDKRIKLSDTALRILLDQRPDDSEKRELIKKVALTPKMHRELWEKWRSELPVDAEIRHYLVLDRKFNENGAEDLIGEYKATLNFAGLLEADSMSFEAPDIQDEQPGSIGGRMEAPAIHSNPEPRVAVASPSHQQRRQVQDISVVQKGERLQITATVDLEGIERLKKMLDAYAEALKLIQ